MAERLTPSTVCECGHRYDAHRYSMKYEGFYCLGPMCRCTHPVPRSRKTAKKEGA